MARRKKGNFSSKGPNWVHSLDGHDKLMGFQNFTFPLAIYGCLHTASRKLLWLRVWIRKQHRKLDLALVINHLCLIILCMLLYPKSFAGLSNSFMTGPLTSSTETVKPCQKS